VVPPFVNEMLPLIVPEMVMDIDVGVIAPPPTLNWPHSTAALVSSVGPEAVVQLTTSVFAEAVPAKAVAATDERTRTRRVLMASTCR
jgi:hypothetical protein